MAVPLTNMFVPTPPRSLAAGATLISQIFGTLAFALALVWVVKHGDRRPLCLAILVVGAVGVFAGGHAHRGSVGALALCALLDISVAVACLAHLPAVKAFVLAPVAWAAPVVAHQLAIAMTIAGAIALLAASACIAAMPQTRRFAVWQNDLINRAAARRDGAGATYSGTGSRG